jgi:predicted RNase H-like HicB family nuclease
MTPIHQTMKYDQHKDSDEDWVFEVDGVPVSIHDGETPIEALAKLSEMVYNGIIEFCGHGKLEDNE